MGYDGSTQRICAAGHYDTTTHWGEDGPTCTYEGCDLAIVWHNYVDDTNGESWGWVDLEPLLEHPGRWEKHGFKGADVYVPAVYRVPSGDEPRCWWDESTRQWRNIDETRATDS